MVRYFIPGVLFSSMNLFILFLNTPKMAFIEEIAVKNINKTAALSLNCFSKKGKCLNDISK